MFFGYTVYTLLALPFLCKAHAELDDPKVQGSDFFVGQSFTLDWSSRTRSPTIFIHLRDSFSEKTVKMWSVGISDNPLSAIFPDIPSGKYYFSCDLSNFDEECDYSIDFFLSPKPTVSTSLSTTPRQFTNTPTTSSRDTTKQLPSSTETSLRSSVTIQTNPSDQNTTTPLPQPTNSTVTLITTFTSTNEISHPQNTSAIITFSTPSTLEPSSVSTAIRPRHIQLGAILGGILGAIAALILALAFLLYRRRRTTGLKFASPSSPASSETNEPFITKRGRFLQRVMFRMRGRRQKTFYNTGRNAAESQGDENHISDADDGIGDLRDQMANQMALLNDRIQQLEMQERVRQSVIPDSPSQPPTYEAARRALDTTPFVMHKIPHPTIGIDAVGRV